MILVVAGTLDGRELAAYLKEKGLVVTISVTSSYGGMLAKEAAAEVVVDFMDEKDFEAFFASKAIETVVDASHPYAANVSKNIMQAAQNSNVNYIRFERANTEIPVYEKLYFVDNTEQAAQKAAALGKTIFLTTGSRALPIFKGSPALKTKRVIVRVLPDIGSLQVCNELGILPKDIIAMQGPFSKELNKAMFEAYGAQVIVSKDSGKTGGVDSKLEAAMELGLAVVIIKRPNLDYKNMTGDFNQVYQYIRGE